MPDRTIRDLIAARMAELGWTQAELARATGIARQNLSPILRGDKALRVQHVLAIESVLNLDLDYGLARWPGG